MEDSFEGISTQNISEEIYYIRIGKINDNKQWISTFSKIKKELRSLKINQVVISFVDCYLTSAKIIFYLAMSLKEWKSIKKSLEIHLPETLKVQEANNNILHLLFVDKFIELLINISITDNLNYVIRIDNKSFTKCKLIEEYISSYILTTNKYNCFFPKIYKIDSDKDFEATKKSCLNEILINTCKKINPDSLSNIKDFKEILPEDIIQNIIQMTFKLDNKYFGIYAKFVSYFPDNYYPRIEFIQNEVPLFLEIYSLNGLSTVDVQFIRLRPIYEEKIIINIGSTFRDRKWDQYWGNIQYNLRKTKAKTVDVLLSECWWADPGPLLSLSMALTECRSKGKYINIFLPDINSLQKNKRAFLGFLGKEMFFDTLIAYNTEGGNKTCVYNGNNKVANLENFREFLTSLSLYTSYKNATCITAKVFDFGKENNIIKIIDGLIDEAKINGLEKHFDIKSGSVDFYKVQDPIYIKQELRQILTELLRNIAEHAYDDSLHSLKLGGIYVRIRHGFEDGRKLDGRNQLNQLFKTEEEWCPRLEYSETVKKLGFIEAFIVDAGNGIATDYNKIKDKPHPLKSFFMKMDSDNPFSKYSKSKREEMLRSPMPGLKYVSEMLGGRESFMRILYKKEWCGATFPINPKVDKVYENKKYGDISETIRGDFKHSKHTIEGTFILVRISCGPPIKLPKNWSALFLRNYNEIENSEVIKAYTITKDSLVKWPKINFIIYDDLAKKLLNKDNEPLLTSIGSSDTKIKTIIWRPVNSLRRDEIFKRIQHIAKEGISHLIIIDQDFSSALMTNWALIGTTSKNYEPIKRISIVSNNFCCVDVYSRYGKMANSQRSILIQNRNGIHIGYIAYLLKKLDSQLFCSAIEESSYSETMFIPNPVIWHGKKDKTYKISNYINFAQTLNEKTCRWIYRRSIGRILAYISSIKRPIPIDHIVESLTGNFYYQNNHLYNLDNKSQDDLENYKRKCPTVLIGSVVVSGETAASIEKEYRCYHNKQEIITINLIPHYDRNESDNNKKNKFLYLLNWPDRHSFYLEKNSDVKKDNSEVEFQRIVDSPMIGRYGNKTWKMIRNYNDNGKEKNLYGCSPDNLNGYKTSEIYTYWQSRNLLRFGHWVNYNYHDCIGLNLFSAIRTDILTMEGMISKFLISHFKRLNPNYIEKNGYVKCDFLACIANEETLIIMDKFKTHFNWLEQKVVLLQLVQRRRKSVSLRINPLDIDRLRTLIANKKEENEKVNVLLFDTQFSSVRTFTELSNLLKSIGASQVDSLAILDRTRNPNSSRLMLKDDYFKRHSRLWRLDIDSLSPSEGYNDSVGCPLCECLENIEQTINQNLGKMVLDRLEEWKRIAEINRLSHASSSIGLQKVNLPEEKAIHFGIKNYKTQRTDFFDKLILSQSTALTSILLEIITITGRYDLITKYLKEIDDDKLSSNIIDVSKIKIEMIISQLLYLRSDISYKRKILLYSELLKSLSECPEENTATAFAGLIFFSINTVIARSLIDKVYILIKNDDQYTNIDFHLVASEIISKAGKEYIDDIIEEEKKNKLLLMSIITRPFSNIYSTYFFEMFSIIGLRDGEAHRTKLKSILISGREYQQSNIKILISLLERLEFVFNELANKSYILSINVEIEKIESIHGKLKEKIEMLYSFLDRNLNSDDENKLDELYEEILKFIYGLGEIKGINFKIKKWFTRNFNQIESYVEDIIQKISDGAKDIAKIDTSSFRQISRKDIDKFRFVTTRQIEGCIYEYIKNAFRYIEKTDGLENEKILFRFTREIEENKVIGIEIENKIIETDRKNTYHISTINKLFFEKRGGKVDIVNSMPGKYCVKIYIPLVGEIQH